MLYGRISTETEIWKDFQFYLVKLGNIPLPSRKFSTNRLQKPGVIEPSQPRVFRDRPEVLYFALPPLTRSKLESLYKGLRNIYL